MGSLLSSGKIQAQSFQDYVPWKNVYENEKSIPQQLNMYQFHLLLMQLFYIYIDSEQQLLNELQVLNNDSMLVKYTNLIKMELKASLNAESNNVKLQVFYNHLSFTYSRFQQAIQFFDIGGSGVVDGYEFACALILLCDGKLLQKAELLFDFYDFDGNQYLSHQEIIILMTNCLSVLNCIEGNKQAVSPQVVEKKARDMILGADQNGDQKLSRKQFLSFCTKNKEVLALIKQFTLVKDADFRRGYGADPAQNYPQRKSTIGESRMTATYGQGFDVDDEDIQGVPDCDSDIDQELNDYKFNRTVKFELIKQGIEDAIPKISSRVKTSSISPRQLLQHKTAPPSGVQLPPSSTIAPSETYQNSSLNHHLNLQYIYGYRCHDSRNNISYNSKGELIFPAASVGIIQNQRTNRQRHFINHKDDITCLVTHPPLNIVATGQVAYEPTIHIWDSQSLQLRVSICGDLKYGVKHLAFSFDGTFLAAVGADEMQTCVIYNWRALHEAEGNPQKRRKAKVWYGMTTAKKVMDIGFSPQGELVLACIKEILFIPIDSTGAKCRKGTGWSRKQPHQTLLSLAFLQNQTIAGTFNGSLLIWTNYKLKQGFKAHQGSITALATRDNGVGFISGGNDMMVIIWDNQYNQVQSLDMRMKKINSLNPKVRAIAESNLGIIAVGLRGGEIVQFTDSVPHFVMRSHFEDQLKGLTIHPKRDQFATIGQDQMLAIWQIGRRKQKVFSRLDNGADCIQFSQNEGAYLAIGYINGQVTILNGNNFSTVAIRKEKKCPITQMKFSPNQKFLAVGAKDGAIITYRADMKFKPHKHLKGHSQSIRFFDYSVDSRGYEVLYFDTDSGKREQQGATKYKNQKWHTWTSPIGWQVQGIWNKSSDVTDINGVDRSPSNDTLACVDQFGNVKLFPYPVVQEGSAYLRYSGHSSRVTKCRFTPNQKYLITTGDKCIFQWKYQQSADSQFINQLSSPDQHRQLQKFIQNLPKQLGEDQAEIKFNYTAALNNNNIQSYKSEIQKYRPKSIRYQQQQPSSDLEIQYIHGYRSFDTRNSVKYNSRDQICYSSGQFGIVINSNTKAQTSYFKQHSNDIVALAIHPDRNIVATGQMQSEYIYIWSSIDDNLCSHVAQISANSKAIRLLAFSQQQGRRLLAIDQMMMMRVYDWAQQILLCTVKVDGHRVLSAGFLSDAQVVTCGIAGHVKFWDISKGMNVQCKSGVYGKEYAGSVAKETHVTVLANGVSGDKVITGTNFGSIVVFKEYTVVKTINKAHNGVITSLLVSYTNDEEFIISAGHDAMINVWNYQMRKPVVQIDLKVFSQLDPAIRAVDMTIDQTKLVVGTRGGEIIQIPLAVGGISNGVNGDTRKLKTLVHGHSQGELWGLASCPKMELFATCGDDKSLRIWNNESMVAASTMLGEQCRALDWSKNGQFIIVASCVGKLYSFQFKEWKGQIDLKRLTSYQSGFNRVGQWIQDIKISPNDKFAAFGGHGCSSPVEIVSIEKNGHQINKLTSIRTGFSAGLTHLDWNTNSDRIIACSQALQLKFIDSKQLQVIPASPDIAKIQWDSLTSPLSFHVQGIQNEQNTESIIKASVCRSFDSHKLVAGDQFGRVKLFNFPCIKQNSPHKEYKAHSDHVANIRFSCNDNFVATVGGHDKTLIIWKILHSKSQQLLTFDDQVKDSYYGQEQNKQQLDEQQQSKQPPNKKFNKFQSKKQQPNIIQQLLEIEQPTYEKPWKNAIKAPTGFIRPSSQQSLAPDLKLQLQFVHGYRSHDCRNNLRYINNSTILYHAAGLGIILNKNQSTQNFFNKHKNDVTSLAYHPQSSLVATGQTGGIYIWHVNNPSQKIFHLKDSHRALDKGVQHLSFSNSGHRLLAICKDVNNTVLIFDINNGTLILFQKGDCNKILDGAWINENQFVTVGIQHFKMWEIQRGKLLAQRGVFGKRDNRLGCVGCDIDGNVYTGSVSGVMMVWKDNKVIAEYVSQEKRAIDAIHVNKSRVYFGSRGGKIFIFNRLTHGKLNKIGEIDIDSEFNNSKKGVHRNRQRIFHSGVRSIDLQDGQLLVGTFGSQILEIRLENDNMKGIEIIHQAHGSSNNQLLGLCVRSHPDQYYTVSDDGTMRKWSISQRMMDEVIDFSQISKSSGAEYMARSIAVTQEIGDRNEEYKIVGFKDGSIRIYDSKNALVETKTKRKSAISEIKVSPNGQFLAVGSYDNFIDVYQTGGSWKLKSVLRGHSSNITHIDWSSDSKYMRSTCGASELLFWDVKVGKQMSNGATELRDCRWATQNCILGWAVQGMICKCIWSKFSDGSDINAIDRSNTIHSNGCQILATGDDFGKVKLFKYPCVSEHSSHVTGIGHSSHVSNVKFTVDDSHLISVGGKDQCIFQWKIVYE